MLMTEKKLAFIGSSHLQDLEEAYENTNPDEFQSIEAFGFIKIYDAKYAPMIEVVEGQQIFNRALEADILALVDRVKADALVTSILGAEHLVWAVQGQERPFDVILPFAVELPRIPEVGVVPYEGLYRMVKEALEPYLRFNKRLSDLTSRPVFQLTPPPPVASQSTILDTAPDALKSMMLENGVPSPIIRYKLWRLWIHVAQEIAAELGVAIIPISEEGTDDKGLLKQEFARDCVHANASHGRLTWRNIDAYFS